MCKLTSLSSEAVIKHLKSIYSTHGIPNLAISDNGPQFANQAFSKFAAEYGFTHLTSSPIYPQANGEAETGVLTMKGLLEKNKDAHLALLSYQSTPLQNGLSPSELLMGRTLQTQLPALPNTLNLSKQDRKQITLKEQVYRDKQVENFNRHHQAKPLSTLGLSDSVWVRDQKNAQEL